MPKIILLANDTTYVYNLRKEVIEGLIANGYEVVVASQPLLFQEELKSIGCRLIHVDTNRHGKNPLSDINLLFSFLSIIIHEKPDIVLTYNIKPNVYGGIACQITRTRYFPNITGLGTAVGNSGLLQRLTKRLYRIGVRGAECVFFQNQRNREFFLENNMLSINCRTHLLPGSGVNLETHKELPYPKDQDNINFLYVARIMKEKGIDIYLQAADMIHKRYKNTVFHICGYCDDKNYLEKLKALEKEGYVLYHGEQKNLIPFYEMSHCIVHPSYYPEGMSNVLLEAAAHGRPIITTRRPGCQETVEEGRSGFIMERIDEEALVDALEKFIHLTWGDKQQFGKTGREKIKKEFDRRIVVKSYIEEIRRGFN